MSEKKLKEERGKAIFLYSVVVFLVIFLLFAAIVNLVFKINWWFSLLVLIIGYFLSFLYKWVVEKIRKGFENWS